ncbi:MAG: helix-turn-helix transcriptional regulator [Rhodobacteraceae bacterium]|nr:helix-turn-helix transcriptional regulator [Paracoccaceae bacterium]
MEKKQAIDALAGLAHDMRIDVFRLLMQAGPDGMAAGEIAGRLDVKANTLSNNLNVLSAAGLVRAVREGRSIRYFARMDGVRDLLGFLLEDCCGGDPAMCRSLLDGMTCR